MRYELLGSLRIIDERGTVTPSPHKMEILLATLLARSDQLVTTGELYLELWGGRAPRRANASLHVYVSQLRQFLNRDRRSKTPIVTQPPGYLIHVGTDEVDAHDFQRLLDRGREELADGRFEAASRTVQTALALWQGPPLDDLREGPIVNSYVVWLEEAKVECTEILIEALLRLGRHREVIGTLRTLVLEHPLREKLYRYLMLALHHSDRRAEALQVYQTARGLLRSELGIEPCRSLRELHQRILNDDALVTASAVDTLLSST